MNGKVMVTGGKGLIGSSFDLDNSFHAGRDDGDLTNFHEALSLFSATKPDYVIHCASKVGGVKANMELGGDFYRENILINTNVIECCRLFKIKRIVNFSSTCVFPDKIKYPLTVDQIFEGPPHCSNAPYAYTKRMAMVQLEAYEKQYGLNSVTVIPCNVYGDNDNYNLDASHVIPALIRKCYEARESGTDFVVWGSGLPLREFIYSFDVARLVERVLFEYEGNEPLIISSDEDYSIEYVATLIAKIMDFTGNIVFDSSKPDGQYKKPSDNSQIKSLFPDFKFTSLEDGLTKTINHYYRQPFTIY